MSSNNVIISALRQNAEGLSATAIAHAVGFSKASSIKNDLAELVSSGRIEIDKSSRYELYKLASKVQKSEKPEEKVTIVEGSKVTAQLPEANKDDLRGYTVASVKTKDNKIMKKVTTPDGKGIRMENDEKLLVVNNEPKYVVKTAEDVIACIRNYALEKSLNVFTVDDIKQNRKISNDKDIEVKDNHIMFLTIQKHNKAA